MRPSCEPGGWNTSVQMPSTQERQRQLDAATASSLQATRRKGPSPGAYLDPVSRQTALTETVRAMKANSGADMAELTAQYGPEGALAMQHILTMPAKESKPCLRTTKADLEAVRALDDFAHGEEAEEEEPGEAVPLSPGGS